MFKTGNGPLHRLTTAIVDADAVLADIGDIALFQEHEAVGHRQQGQLVRRDEVLANTDANHQRAALATDHQVIRLIGMNNGQGVGTAQTLNGRLYRFIEFALFTEVFLDQVRDNLGIGLGGELKTLGPEFIP